MFSLVPLLATAIMLPKPVTITPAINVHAVPLLAKTPNFQSDPQALRSPILWQKCNKIVGFSAVQNS